MRTVIRALVVCTLLQTCQAQVGRQTELTSEIRSAMGGRTGAALVLDAVTGKLIASHDLQRASTRLATPGSSIKPFVLHALLQAQLIDPATPVACRRELNIDGHRLDCTHPESAAMLSAPDALAFSCNSYFAIAATRFRPGEIESTLQRFGLTGRTGLAPEESIGKITPARTLQQRQLLATGAAGIEVTPLELATAYRQLALLARGGKLGPAVLAGLQKSTTYGMARLAQSGSISVAGKTGTASDARDPHTHAWFAGFAPADRPTIVVVVFLERGRGSMDAASVARRIFDSASEPHAGVRGR